MSVGLLGDDRPHRRPCEVLAWLGLGFSLVALAAWASMDRHRYVAFGPEDLKAWGAAVAAVVASGCTAVSAALTVYHRWFDPVRRKRKKKRREKRPDGTSPPPGSGAPPAPA